MLQVNTNYKLAHDGKRGSKPMKREKQSIDYNLKKKIEFRVNPRREKRRNNCNLLPSTFFQYDEIMDHSSS